MRKIIKIVFGLIWTALILFLLLVGATFLPIPENYKVFNVQSGSMEPKIKMGSLVFVKSFATYNIGDVVTFKAQSGKNTITHRIVEKNDTGNGLIYLTKGDANEEADPETFSTDKVIGKVFLTLPLVGYPVGYAQTKVGFILLILIPSVIIIYEELRKIGLEIRNKFKKSEEKEETSEKESASRLGAAADNILTVDIREGLNKKRNNIESVPRPPVRRKIV